MSSLVEELQRDALNSSVDVLDLLRKAYVVASKLKLDQFQAWCKLELDGYDDDAEVPKYRMLEGVLRVKSGRGWGMLHMGDARLSRVLSVNKLRSTIAEVHYLLATSGRNGIQIYHNPETRAMLAQNGQFPYEIAVDVSFGQVAKILDGVRNTILEWSLKLESCGIVGDGMSFKPEEKQAADRKAEELQSVVNNIYIGSVENSALQLASTGSEQRYGT